MNRLCNRIEPLSALFWALSIVIFLVFFIYSQPEPSFINLFVQYSQSDLPPLRPLCGEAPGRDSNPGRADLVAGTLTTKMHGQLTRPLFADIFNWSLFCDLADNLGA